MRTAKQYFCTTLLILAFTWLSVSSLRADAGDPPARVARLSYLQGTVSLQPAGVDQWSAATLNYPVTTSDRIYTDQDGRAEVSAGRAVVRLSRSTDLTITNLTDQVVQVGLANGTVRVRVYRFGSGDEVEADTPNGAVVLMQPSDVRIETYAASNSTLVAVNSGSAQLSGPDLSQSVGAGQAIRLVGTNPVVASSVAMPAPDDFDLWSRQRDSRIMASPSARYVNPDAVGAEDLDAYGTWSPDSDYGPIWYPSNIDPDWAPYREGHWVWLGVWGWTWVDDDPWGYAPFHYGRWVWFHARWGWVPGPIEVVPIWSPALVAFVGGPGFSLSIGVGGGVGVAAWFPLGPGEPYYPWYHCSETYIRAVNITNVNIRYIRNTTIVNNFNLFLRNSRNVTVLNNIHYVNREVAVTAVSQKDFASAKPIRSSLIRVDPKQLQHAQIIPHPSIVPTINSIVPHPVHNVPASAARPTFVSHTTRAMTQGPGERGLVHPAPPVSPHPQNAPPVAVGARPQPGGGAVPLQNPVHNPAAAVPQPLITRNEAPLPSPTFWHQQSALIAHPGRPLEPQQMEKLSQGRPAGPLMDHEFPPHPAPRPAPVAHVAPSPRSGPPRHP